MFWGRHPKKPSVPYRGLPYLTEGPENTGLNVRGVMGKMSENREIRFMRGKGLSFRRSEQGGGEVRVFPGIEGSVKLGLASSTTTGWVDRSKLTADICVLLLPASPGLDFRAPSGGPELLIAWAMPDCRGANDSD